MKQIAIAIVILLTTLSVGWAAKAAKAAPPKPAEPELVTAVDAGKKTVTIGRAGDTQVYTCDAFTRITINGQAGTFEQVKTGMKAEIVTGTNNRLTRLDVMNYKASSASAGAAKKPATKKK